MNECVEAKVISIADISYELSDLRPENLIDVKIINDYLALVLTRNLNINIDSNIDVDGEINQLISDIFYSKGEAFLIKALRKLIEE